MKLDKKKSLAAKVLNVGKKRIIFMNESLSEIKEAITRRDIMDLYNSGAIQIREVSGRKKIVRRKHRRGIGKVKNKAINKKRRYVLLTKKLRTTARGLKIMNKIDSEQHLKIRKMIKASKFKSRKHLLESAKEL